MNTIHQRTPTGGPSIDAIFDVLSNGERRAILDELATANGDPTVTTLVDRFCEREDTTGRDANRFHIRMVHQHLPKMAEVGLVEYDPGTGRVRITQSGMRANTVRKRTADLLRET